MPYSSLKVKTKLYEYQRRVLDWMQAKETEDVSHKTHPLWTECRTPDGSRLYVQCVTGLATLDRPAAAQPAPGGILAEEMGLGKTLETIALIASRPKPNPNPEFRDWEYDAVDHFVYHERLTGSTVSILHSKTTLVVCPECILSQWKEQLEEHAPQLTFAVYDAKKLGTGCDDVGAELDRVRRRYAEYDVLLLAFEWFRNEYGAVTHNLCQANAQVEKNYYSTVRRRGNPPLPVPDNLVSVLAGTCFWRLVIDEVQMVESGRTLAAKMDAALHPVARRALTWYRAVRDERTRRALPFGPPALNPEARGAMAGVLAPRKDELEGLLRAIRTARDSLNPYDAYLCGQLRRCPVPSPAWGQLTNENLAFFSGRRAGLLLLRQWLGAVMRATRAQLQLVDHVERMAGNDGAQLLKRGLDQRQEERQQALEERVAYSRQQLLYACELWDQHRGGALEERAGAAERQAEAQRPLAMECPVCFEEDVTEWQMLPCLHMFCLQCCETLLRHSRLCPQCRRRFQTADMQRVTTQRQVAVPQAWQGVPALEANHRVIGSWSTKVTALIKYLKYLDFHEHQPKSLVYTQWGYVRNVIADALRANGISYAHTARAKTELDRFKNDPSVQVCIMDFGTHSAGAHLVCARHVFMMEPQYRDDLELQAAGRVHRVGQTAETHVHRFVMRDTVEEEMLRIKRGRVLGQGPDTVFQDQQIQAMFSRPPK